MTTTQCDQESDSDGPGTAVASVDRPRSEAAHAAGGAVLLALAGASTGLGNLLFHVLVARSGGSDVYGTAGALLTLGTIAGVLAVGTNYAIAHDVARSDGLSTDLIWRCLGAVWPWLLAGLALLAAAVPAQHFLKLSSPGPVFLAVALFTFIIIAGAPTGVLIGLGRFKAVAALNVIGVVGRLGAGAVLEGRSPLLGALTASMAPGLIIGSVSMVLVMRARGSFAAWSSPVVGETGDSKIAVQAVAGAIVAASVWVIWSIPTFFARHDLGAARAGGFAAAQLVASGILYLSLPLVTAFYPIMARGRRTDMLRFGLAALGLLAVLGVAGLGILGPSLLTQVYGPGFTASSNAFALLGLSAAAVALANFLVWMARAVKRQMRSTYFGCGIAVIAELVLATKWHPSAAALAAGPAIAVLSGMTMILPMALRRDAPATSSPDGKRRTPGERFRLVSVWRRPTSTTNAGGQEPAEHEPLSARLMVWLRAAKRTSVRQACATGVGVSALLTLGLVRQGVLAAQLALVALAALLVALYYGWVEARRGRRGRLETEPVVAATRDERRRWLIATGGTALAAALIAQTWFHSGTAIASGDVSPPYGTAWLSRLFEPWAWSGANAGGPNALERQLPWALVVGIVHRLGGSEVLAQRLWLTGLFAAAAVATIALLRTLGLSRAAAICGAAVYLLNARTVILVPNDVYLANFVMLPAFPAVVLAVSGGRMTMRRGVLLIAAAAPLLGYSSENPPLALMSIAVLCGSAGLAAWTNGRAAGRRALKCLTLGGALLLLFSLYWLVPAAIQTLGAVTTTLSAPSSWLWTEARANLANGFWLNTSWGWYFPQYFPYAHSYDLQPLAFLKYALPALAFLSLAPPVRRGARREPNIGSNAALQRIAIPVSALTLTIIFVSTGTNLPGALLFQPIYHLPFGWLFREPGRFLTIAALGYAILVAITVHRVAAVMTLPSYYPTHLRIHRRDRHVWGRVAGAAIIAAVTVGPAYPIVAGAVVPDRRPILPSEHVKLPHYWSEMAAAIDRAPVAGAVAVLPPDDFYQIPYTWGYYGSDSFLQQMVARHVLAPVPQGYLDQSGQLLAGIDQVGRALLNHDWAGATRVLRVMRSPLLLVRLDIDTGPLGVQIMSPVALGEAAARDPELHMVETAGPLRLYQLNANVPPEEVIDSNVATIDSPTPDFGSLSVLPSGTHLVTSKPRPGIPLLLPVPDLAFWRLDNRDLTIDVAEPSGWNYRTESYNPLLVPADAPVPASPTPAPSLPAVRESPIVGAVRLSVAAGENLIPDGDFSTGAWGPVGDCNNVHGDQRGLSGTVGPFGPNQTPALSLSARYDSACVRQTLRWNAGPIRLSLMVRHLTGDNPRLCVYELGVERCAKTAPLPESSNWTEYVEAVTPDAGATGLILFLYSDGDAADPGIGPAPTRNDYANIQVNLLPQLQVALVGTPSVPPAAGSQLLLTHQAFNSGWEGPRGSEHVLVDGLFNGWLGRSLRSGSPQYRPANLVRASADLSAISAGGVSLLMGLRGVRRRRRERRDFAAIRATR